MNARHLLSGAILAVAGTWAAAHEFTAGLVVAGPRAAPRLAEVVNGFLLAADERDGHAHETSDGHLGGVDVHVLPLPREAGAGIGGLLGNPSDPPDVVVVFGDAPVSPALLPPGIPVVRSGTLPPDAERERGDFAARYRAAYGSAPTRDAARGYNEARRLDLAIRPLDGLVPLRDFMAVIEATAGGLDW